MIFEILFRSRAQIGMASVFMITSLMLSLSSIGVMIAEDAERSNIRTAEDAAWWSLTTITTVGYGDRYPVTLPGRLIAGALMITGVGLFGTLSGVVASFFLGDRTPAAASGATQAELLTRLDTLEHLLRNQVAPKSDTDLPPSRFSP